VQVHGESEPVSKPGLLTLLPPVPPLDEALADALGEVDGEEVGEVEGEVDGEADVVFEAVALALAEPLGVVQLDAEPLTSLTASLNSVAAGSRSYSENIMKPP
jgi:hypothetical protein